MATVDLTGNTSGSPVIAGLPWLGVDNHVVISNTVTTSALHLTGDVLQVMKVPAGLKVKSVSVKVMTAAAGTTYTANVGDGVTAAGYDAAIDLKAAAGTWYHTAIGTDAYGASGNLYTAADTIDLTITTSAVTTYPVLLVVAECVKIY